MGDNLRREKEHRGARAELHLVSSYVLVCYFRRGVLVNNWTYRGCVERLVLEEVGARLVIPSHMPFLRPWTTRHCHEPSLRLNGSLSILPSVSLRLDGSSAGFIFQYLPRNWFADGE